MDKNIIDLHLLDFCCLVRFLISLVCLSVGLQNPEQAMAETDSTAWRGGGDSLPEVLSPPS